MDTNQLTHVGIKGMRWGVRRYQNKDGSLTPAGKKRRKEVHEDYAKAHTRKSVKQMSDKELRERNNRLQMEQQYSKLNPGAIKKGLTIAGGIAAGLGTVIALHNNSKQVIELGRNFVSGCR
jgi:hypothetical protein